MVNIENRKFRYFRFEQTMTKPPNIPGRMIPLGSPSAFVPAPLPPTLEWTPRLIRVLSEADRLIGRLAGEGGRLPNPHVIMRPFVRREAVLSSKIEGTQATLGELLAAEAGAAVDRSPEDLREVGNYVVALEHGIARLQELSLCVRLVRELHEKLMEGARGQHARRRPSFLLRQVKSGRVLRLGRNSSMNQSCRHW
jgi:Fic family protein